MLCVRFLRHAKEKPLFIKQAVTLQATAVGAKTGLLGLQFHAGPPMTIEFKDFVLKIVS